MTARRVRVLVFLMSIVLVQSVPAQAEVRVGLAFDALASFRNAPIFGDSVPEVSGRRLGVESGIEVVWTREGAKAGWSFAVVEQMWSYETSRRFFGEDDERTTDYEISTRMLALGREWRHALGDRFALEIQPSLAAGLATTRSESDQTDPADTFVTSSQDFVAFVRLGVGLHVRLDDRVRLIVRTTGTGLLDRGDPTEGALLGAGLGVQVEL